MPRQAAIVCRACSNSACCNVTPSAASSSTAYRWGCRIHAQIHHRIGFVIDHGRQIPPQACADLRGFC
jgi:hypothetical protein